LAHNLSGLEFHGCSWRDHETTARLVRIAANARLGQSRLEDAKIAQFDRHIPRQAISDVIKRPLYDLENLVLHHPSLVAYGHDNVAFCELTHGVFVSIPNYPLTG
jgi:hypothetical protein